jgi:GT2 family glycosyltransferase
LAFDHTDEPFLGGVTGSDRYTPYAFAPASSWLFRRELFDEVGPWRPARTMIAVPSQDWLFRAHRMGKRLVAVPKVTVVAVGSGGRRRSYADREIDFNASVARALRDDPGFLQAALTRAAARATLPSLGFAVLPHLARAAKNAVRRLIAAAGGNPNTPGLLLRFGGRGAYVDRLRKTRGLSPLPRRTA